MASIHTDDGPTGMRNDFEAMAAHILPYDPVTTKRAAAGSKRTAAQISLVEVSDTAKISSVMKVSIGKTGYTYGTIPQRSTANFRTTRKSSGKSGGLIILARNGQRNHPNKTKR